MTIILKLQGLDVKAGTEDIRTFFKCFHIPDGGVYIVGGNLREAFIAFTSARDAQLAMRHTGQILKGSPVSLHISSMEEMEHKLKALLKRKKPSSTQISVKRPCSLTDANLKPLNAKSHATKAAKQPKSAKSPPPKASEHGPVSADLPMSTATELDLRDANVPAFTSTKLDSRDANIPFTSAKLDLRDANVQFTATKWDPRDANGPAFTATKRDPRDANGPAFTATKRDPRDANGPAFTATKRDPRDTNGPAFAATKRDPRTVTPPQPLHSDTLTSQSPNGLDTSTAFLLGICTVLHGLQASHQQENDEPVPKVNFPKTHYTVVTREARTPEQTLTSKPGYVRLFGLPASGTKEDICHFFKGLTVQEAIVNVKLGRGNGCLVKFASEQEANEALLFNHQSLGSICVEVRGATEKMWTGALQECENGFEVGERVKPKQSPLRETANHKQIPAALQTRRQSMNQSSSKSKKPRHDDSTTVESPTTDYTVKVSNLPQTITKTEIKELLGCPNIAHNNVLHLLDKEGNRTDTAFLILNRTEDYEYAVNLTGCIVGTNAIEVSSITKMMMRDMMAKTRPANLNKKKPNRRKPHPSETLEETLNTDPAAQTCLFVRNMPADVKKSQITSLFRTFKLKMDNITLLHDSDGKGVGEAVVQFKSQTLAAIAQRLHGQDFLGTKVLLTCINMKQREDILARST